MKYIMTIIALLYSFTLNCQTNKILFELGELINGYYYSYYDYPQNTPDFLKYIESREYLAIFEDTYKIFEDPSNLFVWKSDGDLLRIFADDTVFYETFMESPCDDILYRDSRYIENVLLIDSNGISCVSNKRLKESKNKL